MSAADDPALQELLERYLEAVDDGLPAPTADHLCATRPDLKVALAELITLVDDGRPPPGAGDDLVGRVLRQRYRLTARLGAGGMGLVYAARDLELGREVAVKVLDDLFARDAERVERLRREARSLARVHSEHVVAVYDIGVDERPPFVVMERVEGCDLLRLLQALRRRTAAADLPDAAAVAAAVGEAMAVEADAVGDAFRRPWPEQVARLCGQLCTALASAHAVGLVHRDVKPGNVMLDREGRLRLLDFGLARHELDPGLTHTGQAPGTPSYMAPERLDGAEAAAAADVFAAGAVLFECALLEPPFPGRGRELEAALRWRDPQIPAGRARRVPRDLVSIALHALHKDPGRRYASAAAMAEDLARFLRFEPVQAVARSRGRAARAAAALWRRHRRVAPWLAVGAAVLAAGAWQVGTVLGSRSAGAAHARERRLATLAAALPPTLALDGTDEDRLHHPRRGEWLASLDEMVALAPDRGDARLLRWSLRHEADADDAVARADRAELARLLGEASTAALTAAWTDLAQRRDAAAALRTFTEVAPGAERAPHLAFRLQLLAAAIGGDPVRTAALLDDDATAPATALRAWARGMAELHAHGNTRTAIDAFEQADALAPDCAPTLHSLAKLYRHFWRLDDAGRCIARAVALRRSRHVNFLEEQALVLRDQGRFAEAEAVLATYPADRAAERELALANLRIHQGLAEAGGDRAAQRYRDAATRLRALLADDATPAAVRGRADSSLELATALASGDPRQRARVLLDALRDRPDHDGLALNLTLALIDVAHAASDDLIADVASWLGERERRRLPGDLRLARSLAAMLLARERPDAALAVLVEQLDAAQCGDADRRLLEACVQALPEGARARWRRRLAQAGLPDR